MSFVSLLIDTCTVQRYTEGGADAYGIPTKTWAAHLTDEVCRLMAGTGRVSSTGIEVRLEAKVVIASYVLFIGDVDITERDRVVIGSVTYQVLAVADRQNGVGSHHKECLMDTVR